MWWVIGILAFIVVFDFAIYALIRSGAREDEMKERLLKRLHEEMEKRKDGTRGEEDE